MRKVIVNEREISDGKQINGEIENIYKTLFKEIVKKTFT